MASHSDSPSFKIKENPEMVTEKAYSHLGLTHAADSKDGGAQGTLF